MVPQNKNRGGILKSFIGTLLIHISPVGVLLSKYKDKLCLLTLIKSLTSHYFNIAHDSPVLSQSSCLQRARD